MSSSKKKKRMVIVVSYVHSIKHHCTLTMFTIYFIFFLRADIDAVKLGFQAQRLICQ